MSECELTGSNLINTDLTGVILTAAMLDGADFSQAILQRAQLDQIRASGVTFFNTDFSASNMHMMELTDSIATGSLFYEANMNGMQARMLPPGVVPMSATCPEVLTSLDGYVGDRHGHVRMHL